jgi:hypothetical protein
MPQEPGIGEVIPNAEPDDRLADVSRTRVALVPQPACEEALHRSHPTTDSFALSGSGSADPIRFLGYGLRGTTEAPTIG